MNKKILSFEEWEVQSDAPFGSGASSKRLLVDSKTHQKGIFKFPKQHVDGSNTNEYIAEKLAYELAEKLNIPCAKVDLGIFEGKLGSMSYLMLDPVKEDLVHGVDYIFKKHPNYNGDKFSDVITGEIYSVQMILDCTNELNVVNDLFKIIIFDCLIGNSDRHHCNWGIIVNKKTYDVRVSPMYDNGSSLACYVKLQDVENHFQDSNRMQSLINSKSRSRIGWKEIKKPRHFELLQYIKDEYYMETIEIVKSIKDNLKGEVIDQIIDEYSDEIIHPQFKRLIKFFLRERVKRILEIYNIEQ